MTEAAVIDRQDLGRRLSRAIAEEDPEALAATYGALRARGLANGRIHAATANAASRFGDPDLAEAAFEAALALRPGDPGLVYQRGWARLRAGRRREGWRDFEARLDVHRLLPFAVGDEAAAPLPRWRLGEPVPRRLLVFTEQGAGDTVQFARFALRLVSQGVEVQVVASPRVAALVQALGLEVIDTSADAARDGGAPFRAERWCAMMSLPGLMGCDDDAALRAPAYLHVEDPGPARPDGRPRIGLAWQGNPGHPNDAARSIPLAAFDPLLRLTGLEFFSLQVQDGLDGDPRAAALSPLPCLDERPFLSAARSVRRMDLVIAIDSAVAHLAGASGTPCLLLLPPHHHDWRWPAVGSLTPWYDSVRCVHRGRDETWAERLDRLARCLATEGHQSFFAPRSLC